MSGALIARAGIRTPPASGAVVTIKAGDVSYLASGDAAVLQFNRAGTLNMQNLSGALDTSDWISPKSASVGDGYDIRCTLNSGSLDPGSSATSSWLQLNASRYWYVQRASPGTSAASVTVEIRPHGGGAVLASATKTITHSY